MESVQMPMNKTMALGQRLAGMEKGRKRKRKRLSQLQQPSLMGKLVQVLIGNFPLGRVLHLGNSGKDPMLRGFRLENWISHYREIHGSQDYMMKQFSSINSMDSCLKWTAPHGYPKYYKELLFHPLLL
ncbi:hypothetical protein CK203_069311 [Vitis vinifera]|uniref:Uncharacterized protein n=1 Tax=Vitis vinifera TaxID=29760 RepID=A0A438BZU0_VITVI|nr:hypothetical protein CK203_069311 [Vitis vinifera]